MLVKSLVISVCKKSVSLELFEYIRKFFLHKILQDFACQSLQINSVLQSSAKNSYFSSKSFSKVSLRNYENMKFLSQKRFYTSWRCWIAALS